MRQPVVYIMASKRNGTLYIGATSDLVNRIYEHKSDFIDGFSRKYQTHLLVYYEIHQTMEDAFVREKQMKQWQRVWKLRLIEEMNPYWQDLYSSII